MSVPCDSSSFSDPMASRKVHRVRYPSTAAGYKRRALFGISVVPGVIRSSVTARAPCALASCARLKVQLIIISICIAGNTAVPIPTLSSLQVGQRAVIQEVTGEDSVRQRLQAMGLRAGREACVVRCAQLGGPIQVRIGTTSLIMRRRDADRVRLVAAV
jgi:ferrous iron transport protein A